MNDIAFLQEERLREILNGLDWSATARSTFEFGDDHCPGAMWIDDDGKVVGAETMGEVFGLMLCQGSSQDWFVCPWVNSVSEEAYKAALAAFAQVAPEFLEEDEDENDEEDGDS